MTYNQKVKKPLYQREGLFSAISIGLMLILIGTVYLLYPGDLLGDIGAFLTNFTYALFPNTNISLPIPIVPATNVTLYNFVFQFCLGVGIIETTILILRLAFHSEPKRIAETTGNVVAWFGASYMVYMYLFTWPTTNKWFVFWVGIIVVLGLSLVARGFVLLGYRWKKQVIPPSTPPPPNVPATP